MTLNNASALQNQQILYSLLDSLASFYHDKVTPHCQSQRGSWLKALVESPWLGQPGGSWCLMVFFFKKINLKRNLRNKSTVPAPHQSPWLLCQEEWPAWGAALWLVVPSEGARSTCPSHTCIPMDTPVCVCVYISLCTFTLRRGSVKLRSIVCLLSVPGRGEEAGICTASLRWPKYVHGGGEEMLKRRPEERG